MLVLRLAFVSLAVLLVALPAAAQDVDWALKVGQEGDSNPGRLDGAGSAADTATRLMATADGVGRPMDTLRWDASALVAARWFARAHDNDSVVVDARGGVQWQPRAWLAWRTAAGARDMTERRNGRDFTLLDASTSLRLGPTAIGVRATAAALSFTYKPDAEFRWSGPRVGGGLEGAPLRALRWSVSGDWSRRTFPGRRLGLADVPRVDNVGSLRLGLGVTWARGRFDASYSAQWSQSNEEGKALLRHTVSPALTMLPVGDLLVRISGSVQRARCTGGCRLDEFARADEETRNRVGLALEHPIAGERWWLEGRYTYFSQAFEGDGTAAFARHLGLVGVSVRGRTTAD